MKNLMENPFKQINKVTISDRVTKNSNHAYISNRSAKDKNTSILERKRKSIINNFLKAFKFSNVAEFTQLSKQLERLSAAWLCNKSMEVGRIIWILKRYHLLQFKDRRVHCFLIPPTFHILSTSPFNTNILPTVWCQIWHKTMHGTVIESGIIFLLSEWSNLSDSVSMKMLTYAKQIQLSNHPSPMFQWISSHPANVQDSRCLNVGCRNLKHYTDLPFPHKMQRVSPPKYN